MGGSQGEGTPGLQFPHVPSIDEDSQKGQLSPFDACKQSSSPTSFPSGNQLPWSAAKASFQQLPTWNQGTGPALQRCSSSPWSPPFSAMFSLFPVGNSCSKVPSPSFNSFPWKCRSKTRAVSMYLPQSLDSPMNPPTRAAPLQRGCVEGCGWGKVLPAGTAPGQAKAQDGDAHLLFLLAGQVRRAHIYISVKLKSLFCTGTGIS